MSVNENCLVRYSRLDSRTPVLYLARLEDWEFSMCTIPVVAKDRRHSMQLVIQTLTCNLPQLLRLLSWGKGTCYDRKPWRTEKKIKWRTASVQIDPLLFIARFDWLLRSDVTSDPVPTLLWSVGRSVSCVAWRLINSGRDLKNNFKIKVLLFNTSG